MQHWYVLQVMSGHEQKVRRSLVENIKNQHMENFVTEVIVPTENVQEVRKGAHKIVEKRLWPGYILLKMELTDDTWGCIKDTNGVLNFLGGDKPTPLTQKEVDEILVELEAKKSLDDKDIINNFLNMPQNYSFKNETSRVASLILDFLTKMFKRVI